jgi:ADP-ribosylglycohydrolase
MSDDDLRARFVGCAVGSAVGDALGMPVEAFPPAKLRAQFGEVRDFLPSDPRLAYPLQAGQWTDDTQLSLDTLHSLVELGRVDGADLVRRFSAAHETGLRFSGYTVNQALRRLRTGVPWDQAGLGADHCQGNGAAMRTAPIGLFDAFRPERLAEDVRLASMVTHKHPEAQAGGLAVAWLVSRAATGTLHLDTLVEDLAEVLGPCRVADNVRRIRELEGLDTQAGLAELGTTGWVVHTVAAALFCFLRTPEDFEQTVVEAVMGGNDADTTAAVAGAVSGAYNGVDAIPARWREGVERGAEIGGLAAALWERARRDG